MVQQQGVGDVSDATRGADALALIGAWHAPAEDDVLRLLVEIGVGVAGGSEGSLLLHDEARGDLVFAMTVGTSAEAEEALRESRVPLGAGVTGRAASERRAVSGDAQATVVVPDEAAAAPVAARAQAVLAAPLLVRDRLIGVLTCVREEGGTAFGEAETAIFARLAAAVGLILDQRRRLGDAARAAGAGTLAGAAPGEQSPAALATGAALRLVERVPHAADAVAELVTALASLAGGVGDASDTSGER
jgi:GAF domain-containing protein